MLLCKKIRNVSKLNFTQHLATASQNVARKVLPCETEPRRLCSKHSNECGHIKRWSPKRGFVRRVPMYHFQKRILAYRMSEVVPAKLILLVSLTGIFPTACVFEYNSSVVSPSMTYSTLNSSMVSRDSVLNGREALCLSFWCR